MGIARGSVLCARVSIPEGTTLDLANSPQVKRVRGALDQLFAKHLEETAPLRKNDDDDAQSSQASQPPAPLPATPGKTDPPEKQETEPNNAPGKPQESPPKPAQPKRKPPASNPALAASPKRNKTGADGTLVAKITSPALTLVVNSKGDLVLHSSESIPKKVPRDLVYRKFTSSEELEFNRRSTFSSHGDAFLHKFSVTPQEIGRASCRERV